MPRSQIKENGRGNMQIEMTVLKSGLEDAIAKLNEEKYTVEDSKPDPKNPKNVILIIRERFFYSPIEKKVPSTPLKIVEIKVKRSSLQRAIDYLFAAKTKKSG